MRGLSIIIPSRNASNLRACIGAIRDWRQPARIIVVDDGLGCDPSIFWPAVIVSGSEPFIFARNCNLGIDAAGVDDVILLNDDALLSDPAGFTLIQRTWQEHQDFGLIGCCTDVTGSACQHRQPGRRLREVSALVSFVGVFIPRHTIGEIGLLDEQFGVNAGGAGPRGYGLEDDDYCYRVFRSGLKLGVHDGCFVRHSTLPSTFRSDPAHPHDVHLHEALFRKKHGVDARSKWVR